MECQQGSATTHAPPSNRCAGLCPRLVLYLGGGDCATGARRELLEGLEPVIVLAVHRNELRVQHQCCRGACSDTSTSAEKQLLENRI